jgi:hypothetical protein
MAKTTWAVPIVNQFGAFVGEVEVDADDANTAARIAPTTLPAIPALAGAKPVAAAVYARATPRGH